MNEFGKHILFKALSIVWVALTLLMHMSAARAQDSSLQRELNTKVMVVQIKGVDISNWPYKPHLLDVTVSVGWPSPYFNGCTFREVTIDHQQFEPNWQCPIPFNQKASSNALPIFISVTDPMLGNQGDINPWSSSRNVALIADLRGTGEAYGLFTSVNKSVKIANFWWTPTKWEAKGVWGYRAEDQNVIRITGTDEFATQLDFDLYVERLVDFAITDVDTTSRGTTVQIVNSGGYGKIDSVTCNFGHGNLTQYPNQGLHKGDSLTVYFHQVATNYSCNVKGHGRLGVAEEFIANNYLSSWPNQ